VRAIFPGYNSARSIGSCGYIGTPVNGKRPILKSGMDKRTLSERDICTKYITPAIRRAGWDEMLQIREEVGFTKGRIIVRGKLVTRGKAKRADYVLYFKPNIPLALIEAKDNSHSVGDGIQQGLEYAATLDIPFVFSSNGDGFMFHDRTGMSAEKEANLALDAFPSPADLWGKYRAWKALTPEAEQIVLQDYFDDLSGKAPRYYQVNAVNAAIEAIAKGQDRILLVMATGTGKTYTAFQIIWRLWKAGRKKRILYLADPQRADRPDDGERFPSVRCSDGETLDRRQDHRA
jgi:type I restriction enzyme R subunit